MSLPMSNSTQAFYLRLNNHQGFMTGALSDLYHDQSLVDVTLTAEGEIIRAHRIILSACSPYFKNILSTFTNSSQYPVIVLKDMPFADLKAIVEFIYHGEITVPRQQLDSLLKNGAELKIKGLADVNLRKKKRAIDGDISNCVRDYHDKQHDNPNVKVHINSNNNNINVRKRTRKRLPKIIKSNNINKVENGDDCSAQTTLETPSASSEQTYDETRTDEHIPTKISKLLRNDLISHSNSNNKETTKGYESESGTTLNDHSKTKIHDKCITTIDQHIVPFNLLEQSMMIDPKENVKLEPKQSITNQTNGQIPILSMSPSKERNTSINTQNIDDSSDDIPLALIAPKSIRTAAMAPFQGLEMSSEEGTSTKFPVLKTPKLRISRAGIPLKGTSSRSMKKYKCPVCFKVYVSPQNMKEHLRNTHTNPNEKYVCEVCGNEYSWKHARDRHFKSKHK